MVKGAERRRNATSRVSAHNQGKGQGEGEVDARMERRRVRDVNAEVRRQMRILVAPEEQWSTKISVQDMKDAGPTTGEGRWRIVWARGAGHEEGGDGDVQYWEGQTHGWVTRFYIRESKWLKRAGVTTCARGLYAALSFPGGGMC